jgi:hypothetical protein
VEYQQDALTVPMRDGTKLKADLYLPKGRGPWPVLVERTPYNKETSVELTVKSPYFFASRGYAVVFEDVRGRYKSAGDWYPFRDDGWGANQDGYDTVEWLAQQSFCNGRVGTMGGSYSGHTQYALTPTRPPHLAAQFVRESVADYRDGWVFRGGAYELGFFQSWSINHTMLNSAHLGTGAEFERRKGVLGKAVEKFEDWHWYLPLREMPLLKGISDWYYDFLSHPDDGPFWRRFHVGQRHADVETPVYHLGCWWDIFLQGTIDNFSGMQSRARSAQARQSQKMILGPWHHGPLAVGQSKFGDFDFGPEAVDDFNTLRLPWYDYWLKGTDTGIMDGPPVRYFRMGSNDWRTAAQWPPEGSSTVRLYLGGGKSGTAESLNDGTLAWDLQSGTEGADSYLYDPADPVRTLGGGTLSLKEMPGPYDQRRVEKRCLTYTSGPLGRDLEVTGRVRARLWAMSSAPDTDWVVRLSDVSQDGVSRPVCEGILRARYRDSQSRQVLMEPGTVYEFDVDLWSTSNVFLAGHRIRVTVTSSCFPRWDRNLNTGGPFGLEGEGRPAINTVFHDRYRPSHVTLTVRPPQTPAASA